MINGSAVNTYAVNSGGYVYGIALEADIAFDSEGDGYIRVPGESASGIVIDSTADGYKRFMGEGASDIVLDADGEGYLRFRGEGVADIVIDSEGDGQQVEPASSDVTIAITSHAEAYTAGHVDLEGMEAGIVFSATGSIRAAVTRRPFAHGRIEMSATGAGSMIHHASADEAAISVSSSGQARVPGFLRGSGGASISISSPSASASLWRRVMASTKEAVVEIEAVSNIPGKPVIGPFEPAPDRRGMIVPPEKRTIIVTQSRRAA